MIQVDSTTWVNPAQITRVHKYANDIVIELQNRETARIYVQGNSEEERQKALEERLHFLLAQIQGFYRQQVNEVVALSEAPKSQGRKGGAR